MRKLLLLVTSILVVCLASGFVSLNSQQQIPASQDTVATPVEDGVLTDKQKEHSKLYKGYEDSFVHREKIRDELIRTQAGISSHRVTCPVLSLKPLPDLITEQAEKSDAVVTATFVSKASQITTNGTYIFTDYELSVQDVFKDTRSALKPETIITVTRPGGKILLFGQTANFSDSLFKPLHPGRRYLLFLSYLPNTGAYQAVDGDSSYDITDTRVESLNEIPVRAFKRDLVDFIASVKLATGNNEKTGRKQ